MVVVVRCAITLLVSMAIIPKAWSQTGVEGSIRGFVKDEQGAVVIGAVIEARRSAGVFTTTSDSAGAFRLLSLPPGDYTLTARATGFAVYERAGIIVGTSANVGIDIIMSIGSIDERVTVVDTRPLVDTSKTTQAMSISGELQRAVPVSIARHWADFLALVPGIVTTSQNPTVDSYALHGSDFASHVMQVDGADMASTSQNATSFMNLSTEIIDDVEVKTAAVDASAPLGVGAVINVATKSGTDTPHGALGATLQRRAWASNNNPGGSVASLDAFRPDVAIGGPLRQQRAWFFGAYRHDDVHAGVSRTAAQIAALQALSPGFTPFTARTIGRYAFGKVTTQVGQHRLEGWYHYDPQRRDSVSATDTEAFSQQILGGSRNFNGRMYSVWSSTLLTRFGVAYNNKAQQLESGTDATSHIVYATSIVSSGRRTGSSQLAVFDNGLSGLSFEQPFDKWTLSADATWFTSAGRGTHEVQAGLYVQPRNHQEVLQVFANGGHPKEEQQLRDPANPSAGTIPYYREVYDAPEAYQSLTDSRDIAVYVQDSWNPIPRITVNAGVRVDVIKRVDKLFDVVTQRSIDIGPRLGATYRISNDGDDVVRVSWGRVHDVLSTNAATAGTNSAGKSDFYDIDLDGTFETLLVTPPSTVLATNRIIDLDRGQPYVDEWGAGYTRRLPGDLRADVSFVRREYRERTALVEENGLYDGGVFRGYRDERFNEIYRLTSNVWNWPVYSALEAQLSKRAATLQLVGSLTRAWHHIEGTWQPNDPASFIQPAAFPNDRGIGSVRAVTTAANDANSLSGTHMTGNGGWRDYTFRLGAYYRAPYGVQLATSYTWQSGADSGPIITRLNAGDPAFGPSLVTLSNGRAVSNPLSTALRFAYPTRAEGQLRHESLQLWNLRVGKEIGIRSARLECFVDVFNVPNTDADQGFMNGANQTYSPNFGLTQGRQLPRSLQLGARFSF